VGPPGCAASVIDRQARRQGGALALRRVGDTWAASETRPRGQDRPWAPAVEAGSRPSAPAVPSVPRDATPRADGSQTFWLSPNYEGSQHQQDNRDIEQLLSHGHGLCKLIRGRNYIGQVADVMAFVSSYPHRRRPQLRFSQKIRIGANSGAANHGTMQPLVPPKPPYCAPAHWREPCGLGFFPRAGSWITRMRKQAVRSFSAIDFAIAVSGLGLALIYLFLHG